MRTLSLSGSLCLCVLFAGVTAQHPASDVQKRFIGHWRLLKFENIDEKGTASVVDYDGGRIIYDAAGNMSAQLMRSNRKLLTQPSTAGPTTSAQASGSAQAPNPSPSLQAERAAAYSTYTAYYGKYSIDPLANKVTHHVEGSVNPNWVKTDLVRYYAFAEDGRRLMLSLKNAAGRVTGTLTWERIE